MALCYNINSQEPAAPRLSKNEKEEISELRWNGWRAGVITFLSAVYGQMTLARQLPPDPRQDSWLLMRSPIPPLLFSLFYIAAVTWWGPLYMKSRKPFSGLRNVMMAYNAFQVIYSAWLFYEAGMGGWFGSYSFICQTCDYSNNPQAIRMMHCAYWYHFSKYVDFIDTIFFVLHKKYQHISLLHMSHHGLMPISTWYGVRYHPGGHNTFFGFLNCFVHTVMYLYYLLAAMGPSLRPFLWWKKYLTTLQMVQFTLVFLHSLQLAFVDCDVPPVLMNWVGFVSVMFFILFSDFYIKAYQKRGKHKVSSVMNEITGDVSWDKKNCLDGTNTSAEPSTKAKRANNPVRRDVFNEFLHGGSSGISRNGSIDVSSGKSKDFPSGIDEELVFRSRV
ncbi:hypothetical protein OTU49_008121 [Cherax quadricarinatus]|uniref:Elongation of very long chain fatty acids protein n=2 Tax=Cherax quadricarinatus TaxID=27406 RepID=A0AAW0WDL7_CHEQU